MFSLVGCRVAESSSEYSLQKAVEEIYVTIQNEAKWNGISISENQIAILMELVINEFINQIEKCNELCNHLNARGLLEHELTLKKQEQALLYQQTRLDKYEEQLHNLEEAQEQRHLSTSELQTRILSASIREYEQLHVENNRFHGLRIYEKLFPRGYELPKYYEGYGTFENEKVIPLGQIYTETGNSHIALLGEGGIGKTTFLAHLMDHLLSKRDDHTQIPVYIELSKCPRAIGKWFSEKYGKSDFVTRYIASAITDREFVCLSVGKLLQQELNPIFCLPTILSFVGPCCRAPQKKYLSSRI